MGMKNPLQPGGLVGDALIELGVPLADVEGDWRIDEGASRHCRRSSFDLREDRPESRKSARDHR